MPKGHFPGGGGLGAIYHTYYTFVTLETSRKLGRVHLRDRRARVPKNDPRINCEIHFGSSSLRVFN